MKRMLRVLCAAVFLCLLAASASASFSFEDDRFRGVFTTENMDAIIAEYELLDGWYWTTPAGVVQTYHGVPDCPGWTDTAVSKYGGTRFLPGWFGCRWGVDRVSKLSANYGGYGECFGFAQFIGYLLSGDTNAHRDWNFFYTVEAAGGLRVGDIIRVEYRANKKSFRHSAVVYAVNGEEILFLQISGSNYNRISVGRGLSDGNLSGESSLEVISQIPGLKICRSPLNCD